MDLPSTVHSSSTPTFDTKRLHQLQDIRDQTRLSADIQAANLKLGAASYTTLLVRPDSDCPARPKTTIPTNRYKLTLLKCPIEDRIDWRYLIRRNFQTTSPKNGSIVHRSTPSFDAKQHLPT